MIRKRPEKDTENPPGQIRYDVPPLDKSIEEWKRWEKERNSQERPCRIHDHTCTQCTCGFYDGERK